jgi:hypothetical protein
VFELVIVLLPEGAGTTYLFNEVKEGSELVFRGAQGVFTLPEKIEKICSLHAPEQVLLLSAAWCNTLTFTIQRIKIFIFLYPVYQGRNGLAKVVMYTRLMKRLCWQGEN